MKGFAPLRFVYVFYFNILFCSEKRDRLNCLYLEYAGPGPSDRIIGEVRSQIILDFSMVTLVCLFTDSLIFTTMTPKSLTGFYIQFVHFSFWCISCVCSLDFSAFSLQDFCEWTWWAPFYPRYIGESLVWLLPFVYATHSARLVSTLHTSPCWCTGISLLLSVFIFENNALGPIAPDVNETDGSLWLGLCIGFPWFMQKQVGAFFNLFRKYPINVSLPTFSL